MTFSLVLLILLALAFDFLNGVHGASNILATMMSSRALQPRWALALTALAEFSGPLLFGVAVAQAIGNGIVQASAINLDVLLAALLSAVAWSSLTWFLGIPSSSSHALIGGMVGAVMAGAGGKAVLINGLGKVMLAMFASPVLGMFGGFLFTRLVFFLARDATPRINSFFKRAQIFTATALALSHGSNDGQKTMGIITLGLLINGNLDSFSVPGWVILISAAGIAAGAALGGYRLIRTLGAKFYRIRPVDGFSAQATAALVVLLSSLAGGPVSTTQVASSAIMGVGAAERLNKVRWQVAGDMATAWLVTIPINGLLAAGIYGILTLR